MAKRTFTKSLTAAIDYIGSHRRTNVKPKNKSCPISVTTANRLVRAKLAMWVGDSIMLTYLGEREYTKLHPRSKYAIK